MPSTPAPPPAPVLTPLADGGDLGLVDALAQLSFILQGALSRIAASHGLSLVQLRLLGILRDRRPTITELARLLQLDKSSITGLVDRAESRGLVERVPSELDGRSVQVRITRAGRALVTRGAAEFAGEVDELTAGLTASQQARLSSLSSRVVVAAAARQGIDVFEVDRTG